MASAEKLLIIGLDGLDHHLTSKWGVEGLLQRRSGVFRVDEISILYTPLIWSSILCGFNVEEAGYTYEEAVKRSMGFVGVLRSLKNRLIGKRRVWFLRKLMIRLGFLKGNFILPDKLLRQTFLEEARARGLNVYAVEVPGYNEVNNGLYRLKMHELVLSTELDVKKEFIEGVKRDSIERLRLARQALSDNDLIMCYLPLPDLAHHLFHKGIKSRIRMYRLYRWLEHNVEKYLLNEAYEMGFNVLIISDHGFDMRRYTHSEHAFWSLNTDATVSIMGFRDIKTFVLSQIGVST